MAIKTIKFKNTTGKILLISAAVAALAICFYIAKWSFANMASVNTAEPEVAALMARLAPDDPQTRFAAAVMYDKTFLPEDQQKSLAEYETATALSPNNYLLWLELGKARERSGDSVGAEKALVKAKELAPNYSMVQWALGNALMRQGQVERGFGEIRSAVVGNQAYAAPAIALALQAFDGDVGAIKKVISESIQLQAALAILLARQKRFDDAIEIWNSLPADEKRASLAEAGKTLFSSLIEAKKYAAAQVVLVSLSNQNGAERAGQITDGGFENDIKLENASVFEWQISSGLQPQIALTDGQKHGGNRSLVMIFNSTNANDFRTISQTIVIDASKTYRFDAYYKSELKTGATLRWEIVNAADGQILQSTAPIAANSDWSALSTQFRLPYNAEAIIIRLARDGCKSSVCPISGRVWFDDLRLFELNKN